MSEENKTIVRRYVEEGLNQENLVLFDELLAADFANHSPRLGIMGRETTVQDFAQIFKAFPDRHSTIEDIIGEGDKVFVRTTAISRGITNQEEIEGWRADLDEWKDHPGAFGGWPCGQAVGRKP